MKKTFIIFSTITLLLFNVCPINLSAQCSGLVTQAGSNTTITNSTVGQSWLADCTGTVQSITVSSGTLAPTASNVTLRIWQQGIPILGQITVIHIQTGLTLPGLGATTTISIPDVSITLLNTYFFTLTAESPAGTINLQANGLGLYAGGYAVQTSLFVLNNPTNVSDLVEVALTDLAFNIVATSSILPVELTTFKATKLGNQSQLDWTTATESDNQHFAIERSKDGKTFKEIGIVNSKGASYEKQDYTFIDPTPAKGFNYYRLKQVDFNGKYDYSKVEMVALKGFAEVMLYPNPAKESITIETSATDKHDVKIMDYMGRIWLSKTLENDVNQLNIASLPKGLYFLESYIDNELVRKKIVKE